LLLSFGARDRFGRISETDGVALHSADFIRVDETVRIETQKSGIRHQLVSFIGGQSLFNVIVPAVKADQIVGSDFEKQRVVMGFEILIHIFLLQCSTHHAIKSPFGIDVLVALSL
jgi:hypothetical protein